MVKLKSYNLKTLSYILLVLGIGLGLYYGFVLRLYQLDKKESNHTVNPSTLSLDSPIQTSLEMKLFLFYYLRSVK